MKNKPRILVTGADGFIGSHLVEALLKAGYPVRAFVFYNSFNSWGWLDGMSKNLRSSTFDVFSGDVRDPHGVRQAVKGCEVVMHLAALIGIPYSYHSPDTYVDTNVKGTLNILQASKELGVRRVLHTSTSEVYGTAQFVPITEKHPLQAQSPYAATKIAADQLALSFYRSFKLPVTVIRPFNTYGPRQSARAVIPTIITQIASGYKKIKLGSLHPTRDFNYVTDTAAAFVRAIEAPKIEGEVLNVGNQWDISIGDLAELIASLMKKKVKIEADDQRVRPRASEVERLLADSGKARRLLGWQPEYSGHKGLERGLRQTINWLKKPENLKKYKPELCNI